tara:strand:- start:2714 stop:3007 length:294 start_codon:yes stop_codon:yes gene_type:complete
MCEEYDEYNIYMVCGYISGILFPLSLIPQVYKSYKTKTLNDISYYWQITFMVSLICAIIYSVYYDLKPIYLSSILELILILSLTIMKYIYRNDTVII